MASCRQLDRRLDELARAGSLSIEIDFSEITFMDSSGLGVLLGARRKFAGEESSLVLTSPPGLDADLRADRRRPLLRVRLSQTARGRSAELPARVPSAEL